MPEDYYSILGVPRTATQSEIRAAYVRLAKESHPDRFPVGRERLEADKRFQLINESYNHLRDERLRREYDKTLARPAMDPKQEAALCFNNARFREEAKQYGEALTLYYEAMRLDPDTVSYAVAAARLMAEDRSRQRQAAELLEQAISKQPSARETYLELGKLYGRLGLLVRARRVYENGLKEHPRDPELRSLLAQVIAAGQRVRG